jgi:dCTP deaminase
MSVLVDSDILDAIDRGVIVIDPFLREALGTNSYDVHLAPKLLTYKQTLREPGYQHPRLGRWVEDVWHELDCRKVNETIEHEIGSNGFVLEPGVLYLASTVEYTESHEQLPILNGKSSLGRLGLSIHITAGTGDIGFLGHWTMELFVIHPLRIYAGMPIGQLLWFTAQAIPDVPYNRKPGAKYNNRSSLPQASITTPGEE